ncbi:Nif11-like leader peptide family natural product precursor [Synechococcus sp. GFB01]|uniref:Nif11-like leader peptide family natural product precursor n=1 Tax=Synechococcus sp. GFB01 TaxID=1662190 RepID=UPI00064F1BE6|nr:Nif11-like leader peptide family natural product precursor [Synechococcus sp. GFB01]
MADGRTAAEQRAAEEQEQQQLEQFLAHAARSPELQARLKGVDPYEVVEIAAAEGYRFGVFTLHRAVCTGYAMPKVRQ